MHGQLENFIGTELHMNFLLLIGIAMFAGTIGARFFQKLKIPQVVGYIVTGLLVGEMGFKLISVEMIDRLKPMNYFALGIIGFIIGGELSIEIFKKYGKQFLWMVLAEGLGAFFFVAPAVALIVWFFTHDITQTIILSIVIAAISSATDPASTIQVFWEYRTRGLLTTAIIAIVALDDALALALYAICTSFASIFTGGTDLSVSFALEHLTYELLGALGLGVAVGLILTATHKYLKHAEKLLPYTVGLILLVIGIAQAFNLDIILASMAFGITIVNLLPSRSQETFDVVKKFAPPIYVLFFVFVGARLTLSNISLLVGILTVAYVLMRSLGKWIGVYFAAKFSGAPEKVQKYSGMCLFTQAGVAVGLSIMASQHFEKSVGDIIITVITATTFIVQLIGPPFIKLAVTKAGEIDLNVTEDDLIHMYSVKDVMKENIPKLLQSVIISKIIKEFSESDETAFYVTDPSGDLLGSVSLDGIRSTLSNDTLNDVLIAHDVMEPIRKALTPDTRLEDAIEIMDSSGLEHLPVVMEQGSRKLVGVIDYKNLKKMLAAELVKRKIQSEC